MVGRRGRHPKLSKSRYVAGLQCELKLWNLRYARHLASPAAREVEQRIEVGRQVGLLATQRHPGGVMIAPREHHHDVAVAHTRLAMAEPRVPAIFEAGLTYRDVCVRLDILERVGPDLWNLVEVKSASKIKDINVDDLAVQYWVATGAGVRIDRAGVLTVNREYVYKGGQYDASRLFVLHDLTEDVRAMRSEVGENVRAMFRTLARGSAPAVQPSGKCHEPFPCEFWTTCTQGIDLPEHPATDLPRLRSQKLQQLADLEVDEIPDIPDEVELTLLQKRARDCVQSDSEFVSDELLAALDRPTHPIHHLDVEALQPALPRYVGTRPYQVLPFQWSDDVEHADGRIEHREYLCSDDADPRAQFAHTLLEALGTRGTICIYSRYEERIMRELAAAFPALARRLEGCCRRIWDLRRVIQRHYYHPRLHGSFALRQVLSVLVPELGYHDLAVRDGREAATAYLKALATDDPAEREVLRASLLSYCRRDTEAMIALRAALRARCR